MNNRIRELSQTKQPNGERANVSSIDVALELGEEELSKVSGGSLHLHLHCVSGRHIATGRITC